MFYFWEEQKKAINLSWIQSNLNRGTDPRTRSIVDNSMVPAATWGQFKINDDVSKRFVKILNANITKALLFFVGK